MFYVSCFMKFMDKKNLFISTAVIAVFIAGLLWLGAPNKNQSNISDAASKSGAGQISAGHIDYDFGPVSMAKGKVSHAYKIVNPSAEPATISKIYTSCMCTVASLTTQDGQKFGPFGMPGHGGPSGKISTALESGQEAELEVVFDPTAHGPAGVGAIDRTVYVETATGQKLELNFTATVTP